MTELSAEPWQGSGTGARARPRRHTPASPLAGLLDWLPASRAEARYWMLGVSAAERIGASLERIARRDSRWRPPIHSVPVGERSCDVAHLLIGSAGVFTVNVKYHPHGYVSADRDQVRVDDDDWHYVAKNRREADRASAVLSRTCGFAVPVEALIVIVGAKHVSVARPADGVHILQACYLPRWLRSRPAVYPDGVVQRMYDSARMASVWRTSAA